MLKRFYMLLENPKTFSPRRELTRNPQKNTTAQLRHFLGTHFCSSIKDNVGKVFLLNYMSCHLFRDLQRKNASHGNIKRLSELNIEEEKSILDENSWNWRSQVVWQAGWADGMGESEKLVQWRISWQNTTDSISQLPKPILTHFHLLLRHARLLDLKAAQQQHTLTLKKHKNWFNRQTIEIYIARMQMKFTKIFCKLGRNAPLCKTY